MIHLQTCLIFEFDLLRDPLADTPLLARFDVGIEPSDITIFMKLLFGADVGTDIEGMFQINDFSVDRSQGRPLQPKWMEMWRDRKRQLAAAGFPSDPVVIVEFANDFHTHIFFAINIPEPLFGFARKATPFEKVSALTSAKVQIPMTTTSCIDFINMHIRSDTRNQLLLRTKMTEADIELIKGVACGDQREAVQVLRKKMDREAIYKPILEYRNL